MAIVVPYQPDQVEAAPIARPQMSGADPVAAAGEGLGNSISGLGTVMMDLVRQETEKQNLQAKTAASTAAIKAKNQIEKQMTSITGEAALPSKQALPAILANTATPTDANGQPIASMLPTPFGPITSQSGPVDSDGLPIASTAPQNPGVAVTGLSQFDDFTNKYVGNLTSEYQKQQATNLFAEQRNALELALLRHQDKESVAVNLAIAKAGAETQMEEAVRYAATPELSQAAIDKAVAIQSEHYRSIGTPQEVIDQEAATLRSKAQIEVIKAIDAVNPTQALERFKAVKDQILPSVAGPLEHQLKLQNDSYQALSIADKVTAQLKSDPHGNWDPETAQELIRKETSDPSLIKMSRELVHQAIQDHAHHITQVDLDNQNGIFIEGHNNYWDQNKQMPMAVVKANPRFALLDAKGQADTLAHVEAENYRIEAREYTRDMRAMREENKALAAALKAKSQGWTQNANYYRVNPEEMAQMPELEWKRTQNTMSTKDWVALDKQRTKLIKEPQYFTQQTIDMSAVRQVLSDAEFNDQDQRASAIHTAINYLSASRKTSDHVFSPQEAKDLTVAALQPVAVNTTRKSFMGISYGDPGEIKRLGDVKNDNSIIVPQDFRNRFPKLDYSRQVKLYKEYLKRGTTR